METTVYCRNIRCTFNEFNWHVDRSVCGRGGGEVYINEEGRCAMILLKSTKHKCPWPYTEMKPYAGRNFCPFCGRDLREE